MTVASRPLQNGPVLDLLQPETQKVINLKREYFILSVWYKEKNASEYKCQFYNSISVLYSARIVTVWPNAKISPSNQSKMLAARLFHTKVLSSVLHTAHWTLYTAHCTLHTSHCTLHTAHYSLHTAHCSLHTAHCTQFDRLNGHTIAPN